MFGYSPDLISLNRSMIFEKPYTTDDLFPIFITNGFHVNQISQFNINTIAYNNNRFECNKIR